MGDRSKRTAERRRLRNIPEAPLLQQRADILWGSLFLKCPGWWCSKRLRVAENGLDLVSPTRTFAVFFIMKKTIV